MNHIEKENYSEYDLYGLIKCVDIEISKSTK